MSSIQHAVASEPGVTVEVAPDAFRVPYRRGLAAVPMRFVATYDDGALPFVAHLEIRSGMPTARTGGRWVGRVSRLLLVSRDPDRQVITAEDYRRMPLGRAVQLALEKAELPIDRHAGDLPEGEREHVPARAFHVAGDPPEDWTVARSRLDAPEPTPPGRGRRTDSKFLARVAQRYREAVAAGVPPVVALSRHYNTRHTTAREWVVLARRQGYIGAALGPTPGEAVDQ